jgi:DNA polymerase V
MSMPSGGKRVGAGRPKGQGPHGEATKAMRIPVSMIDNVVKLVAQRGYKIPLYSSRVPAGLPSAGDGYVEEYVDLCQKLVPDKEYIFSVYASGDSMINAGIADGDLLLVNSQEEARHHKIVIAMVDGQQTVKRLHIENGYYSLLPENNNYQPIVIKPGMDFSIQGVVMSCIKIF